MTTETRKLSQKQERLADFYISMDGNAYQAAKAAGYSESFARVDVHKALAAPSMQQALQARKQRIAESAKSKQLTPERVMAGLLTEAEGGDTSASRVSAWRTLADILGMTAGNRAELPQALSGMLEALKAGFAAGQQAQAIQQPRTIEILPSSLPADSEQGAAE